MVPILFPTAVPTRLFITHLHRHRHRTPFLVIVLLLTLQRSGRLPEGSIMLPMGLRILIATHRRHMHLR